MKHLITMLLLLITSSVAFGQITGKVVDARDQSAVIGASVSVKGTTDGTSTDVEGNFKLPSASGAATLVVRAINFTTQEVAVGGRASLTVALAGDTKQLAEVVITALGVSRQTRSLG